MSDEVAQFLKMVNERRAQELARQARSKELAAAQAASPRQAAPAPTPWQYSPQSSSDGIEIITAEPIESARSQQTRRHSAPASAPQGVHVENRPPLDHEVGSIAHVETTSQRKPTSEPLPADAWLALLRSPAGLRSAFLLSEIFRRPEW